MAHGTQTVPHNQPSKCTCGQPKVADDNGTWPTQQAMSLTSTQHLCWLQQQSIPAINRTFAASNNTNTIANYSYQAPAGPPAAKQCY